MNLKKESLTRRTNPHTRRTYYIIIQKKVAK